MSEIQACIIKKAILKIGEYFGFLNINYPLIHGDKKRLHIHKSVNLSNTLVNTRSGNIYIKENTFFGHNCMILTGKHLFENGTLKLPKSEQVLKNGNDIYIGSGCWIASGSIILGNVKIGNNCIVMAGAIVTKDIPDSCIVAGVPAKIIKNMR